MVFMQIYTTASLKKQQDKRPRSLPAQKSLKVPFQKGTFIMPNTYLPLQHYRKALVLLPSSDKWESSQASRREEYNDTPPSPTATPPLPGEGEARSPVTPLCKGESVSEADGRET